MYVLYYYIYGKLYNLRTLSTLKKIDHWLLRSENGVVMIRERVTYFALLGSYFLYLLVKQSATSLAMSSGFKRKFYVMCMFNISNFILTACVCICECTCMHMHHSLYVEVRGHSLKDSTIWMLQIELRSLVLAANPYFFNKAVVHTDMYKSV